jgi:ATP-dependent Clp protease ATP-binding subunit ClpB
MEVELAKVIVGQKEGVTAICKALRRSRADLKDPRRPIGTFALLGPTGVGKTLLAKTIAEFMFGDSKALIQLDMSEYMERHNASRMVGSPPGYVGYEEGGQLTEAVRRHPYSVILFDEIEKAHHDVFNVLLQILDDGRLTDSQGRTVDFKNTILIMTSNLGSPLLIENASERGEIAEPVRKQVMAELRAHFRPEFLNRVDEVVLFKPLTLREIKLIVELQLQLLRLRLADRHIGLELTDPAKEYVAREAYDPVYGARPIKRFLQRHLETTLSRKIIKGEIPDHTVVKVDFKRGELAFSASPARPAPSGSAK